MGIADCESCWEATCVCGVDYLTHSTQWLDRQIAMLQRVRAFVATNKYPAGAEFGTQARRDHIAKFEAFVAQSSALSGPEQAHEGEPR